MTENFAVFILSHGRADNIKTLRALQKGNYTGKTYIIVDNQDKQLNKYYSNFGSSVIEFNKDAMKDTVDTFDNLPNQNGVVYARNAVFDIAKELGLEYFLVLDDDYTLFEHRIWVDGHLAHIQSKNLDKLFSLILEFLNISGAITVTVAQGGDFAGGTNSGVYKDRVYRKAMNTFFCKTDRPFDFFGRLNEDTCAYTYHGNTGKLMFTLADADVQQTYTQQSPGGLTDLYLDLGTYVKSFYSIMCSPQAVSLKMMGVSDKRIHHFVQYEYCAPKIISSRYKKE